MWHDVVRQKGECHVADDVRGGLLPAYLIVGADELKSRSAQQRLRARLEPGLEAFNLDQIEAGPDLEEPSVRATLDTLPVGSGFRLVMVGNAEKLPKPCSEAIVTYLKDPSPYCVVCLVSTSLAKSTRLYKAVKAVGAKSVIDCTPKKRWELTPGIQKIARSYGMSISDAAASELVSRVGESTLMLDTQLRTLATLLCASPSREITVEDVERGVARVAEVKPWDFLDSVCARDARKALSLYRLMAKPSQVALLSLLVGRLRELVCARSLDARGEGSLLASELGKQSWQIKRHLLWARGFADGELERALMECRLCERELKGGSDQDLSFTKLVLSVCGC